MHIRDEAPLIAGLMARADPAGPEMVRLSRLLAGCQAPMGPKEQASDGTDLGVPDTFGAMPAKLAEESAEMRQRFAFHTRPDDTIDVGPYEALPAAWRENEE